MQPNEMFAVGLGLSKPWKIVDIEFVNDEVHIHVDFERGARFGGLGVHDTAVRAWRHLNFFKYPCYVHARVPRVKCLDGTVKTVDVPWAHPGSGFTLDFEVHALSLVIQMPVLPAARILKIQDTRLWRLVHSYVKRKREGLCIGQPLRVGVDETACRRGHHYITAFVDLDRRRVLFACEGKGARALAEFRAFLVAQRADPDLVAAFSCDMSPAFVGGIQDTFPKASITLDRYHLVALVSRAVDVTRKVELSVRPALKKTRWLWLKNPSKLSAGDALKLKETLETQAFPMTGKAYGLRLAFQELFKIPKHKAFHAFHEWVGMAISSDIPAMVAVATTLFNARKNILNWFETRISNGLLEGFNSVLQATKNKARGYRNTQNLIAMSYLLHGKLEMTTPTI